MENISHQKINTFCYCVVNDEVPSNSSQIAEEIKFIQEVVLPEISKMNDPELDKKQRDQKQFPPKNHSRKKNGFDIVYYIHYHTN